MASLCSRYVWPRPPVLRRQRDQARLFDPARAPDAESSAELERRADRSAAGRAFRRQGRAAQSRPDALEPGAELGQGHQDRLRQYQRQSRGHRNQARFPQGVRAAPLPGAGRHFYLAPTRSRAAASWRSPVCGRTRIRQPANGYAALRSSPLRRTNCAPSCTTACRSCSSPKPGRSGSARSRPTCCSLSRCSAPTLPMKWFAGRSARASAVSRTRCEPDRAGCRPAIIARFESSRDAKGNFE